MKKIYLDYAATTPVDKRVAKAMQPFLDVKFGNVSSLHSFGVEAKKALDGARAVLARAINADSSEIYFTSSDTESNNLIIKGIAGANREKGNHIILSAIEHDSVVEIAESLKRWGFEISFLPVDAFGFVNVAELNKMIMAKTILVSVIFASNEIGTIQPIAEIGKICREKQVLFHTDASQAFGKLPIDVKKMNIDLLSAGSHKIYGPKGAALAYIRNGVKVEPLIHGGGQENGMRGGTQDVAAIVGFAKAAEISVGMMEKEQERLEKLDDFLVTEILKIEGAHLNGPEENVLPNIINIWFDGIDGELLMTHLDLKGFAVSTGSACSSVHLHSSHILKAIGLTENQANGSLRISLGRQTTKKELEVFVERLAKLVPTLR
jgi:cysteine desulfurase